MQLTIEIPDKLAKQLEPEQERLAEIIARGMRRSWTGASGLRREVISFLAGSPTAKEMLAFRPSKAAVKRSRELLARNQEGALRAEEEAELDEMCDLDSFVSLIKTEILRATASSTVGRDSVEP
jgi:hypothetical protein